MDLKIWHSEYGADIQEYSVNYEEGIYCSQT
jgi:hypothetical protein